MKKLTKAERQAWWRSLSKEDQTKQIKRWMAKKATKVPQMSFGHRTKFPFFATIKPLDEEFYEIIVRKIDGEIVIESP